MNLGKQPIILGYPWLEEYNLDIDWKEGRLLGPHVHLKTPIAVTREQQHTRLQEVAVEDDTI